jgi:hypothetical protein
MWRPLNPQFPHRCCKYQDPEKPQVCENNRNLPNLVGMTVFVVSWGFPESIGNDSNEIDIYKISHCISILVVFGYQEGI